MEGNMDTATARRGRPTNESLAELELRVLRNDIAGFTSCAMPILDMLDRAMRVLRLPMATAYLRRLRYLTEQMDRRWAVA